VDLTEANKKHIDGLSYEQPLSHWRFAPVGDPWFEGETGTYWSKVMREKRDAGADHVGASKRIGWDPPRRS
jgi:hypothetical protein